jgi:hypothetical protein
MLIKMRHISGKKPGYFVLLITFFVGVSVYVFGVCRTVFFIGGVVLQYVHRRYAFHADFYIVLLFISGLALTDRQTVNTISAL